MAVNLRFKVPRVNGSPTPLVFGADYPGGVLKIEGTLPDLTGTITLNSGSITVQVVGTLPNVEGQIDLEVQTAIPEVFGPIVSSPWQEGARTPAPHDVGWPASTPLVGYVGTPWQEADLLGGDTSMVWRQTGVLTSNPAPAPWRDAQHLRHDYSLPWRDMGVLRGDPVELPWRDGVFLGDDITLPWREALSQIGVWEMPWQDGLHTLVEVVSGWQRGVHVFGQVRLPWRDGTVLISHGGPLIPDQPPEPPGAPCYDAKDEFGNIPLVFYSPFATNANLVFICDNRLRSGKRVPIRRIYMIKHNATLFRVSDGKPIKATTMSVSLDSSSWTWSFQATIDAKHIPDVRKTAGVFVQLIARVNGHDIKVVVESINRERRFNSNNVTISGRGLMHELDAPFERESQFAVPVAMTAQQLAQHVLTENGAPLDWTLDWQMEDWLVQPGPWSVSGTRKSALDSIAAAAGGYIQPHPTNRVIRFLKKYPEFPVNWPLMLADFEIPSSVIEVEGMTQMSKALYNKAIVSGTTQGVVVEATRDGTDGLLPAQPVTDPLIQELVAGRERAISILADVGEQTVYNLRTPVLPDFGYYLPGNLIRYVDGSTMVYGIVRGWSVEATEKEAWQRIVLETHDAPT